MAAYKNQKKVKIMVISIPAAAITIFSLIYFLAFVPWAAEKNIVVPFSAKNEEIRKARYYQYTSEGRREKILLYLETKYNQEFEVLGISRMVIPFSPSEYEAKCIPKGGNEYEDAFEVYVLPSKKLNLAYDDRYARDSYFGILIRPKIEPMINDIVSNYFSDAEVEITLNAYYDYNLNDKSTLADFLRLVRGNQIYVVISASGPYISEESLLDIVSDMCYEFEEKGVLLGGRVDYVFPDENGQQVKKTIFLSDVLQ
jgi:hypothetical protein